MTVTYTAKIATVKFKTLWKLLKRYFLKFYKQCENLNFSKCRKKASNTKEIIKNQTLVLKNKTIAKHFDFSDEQVKTVHCLQNI